MKRIVLLFSLLFALSQSHAQFLQKIKADSVLITGELNLENSTKDIKGFLYNKGNGRTEFRKVVKLNDTTFIMGDDTLVIGGAAQTASNGITKSGNEILLGQTIGAPGNATDFTSDREIPLATNRLHFKDGRITMKLSTSYEPAIHIYDSANKSLLWIKALSQLDEFGRQGSSIFIGDSAGYLAKSFTNPTTTGTLRTALGYKAMFADNESNFSTAIGAQAMMAAGYKPWSTALGYSAMANATTGSADNTALGYVTMASLQTGKDNVGIGSHNMQKATHIDSSVAVGTWALSSSNNAGGNFRREVAIGMNAGRLTGAGTGAFIGSRNVRIGFQAGQDIGTTATGNVLIGHDVARGINVGDNKLYIANTNTPNPLLYGEFDNALLRVGGRLKINNVPDGSNVDSILVWNNSDSLVKKIAPSALTSTAWSLTGNAGTNTTNNFIGTTDSQALAIRTNNIEKMRINANGFVGIGTSNPAYPLHIVDSIMNPGGNVALGITTNTNTYSRFQIDDLNAGTSAGAGILMRNNVAQGLQLYMGSTNNAFVPAGALIRTASSGGMNIVTDTGPIAFGKSAYMGGNEFARFLNNGNFGIGTSTPTKKFHVIGQGLFSDTLTAQKNVSVTGNIDVTQGVINMTTTGISPHININGNQDGWPRIVIKNVANTVSAGAGSLYINNAGHSLQYYMGSSINAFVPAGALIRSNGPGGMAIVADSGVIAFGKDARIGINEFARFLTNGNLGIGTKTPAYKLDVNGKLGVRTIDSTSTAPNILYQDAATGEIKKAAYSQNQTFAQTATTTITSDVETTLISSGTGDLTIPASAWKPGKSYKVTVYGVYSTSATNPANIIVRLKLGTVTIAASSNIYLGSGKSNVPFTLEATITCRSTGSSGTVYTFGNVFRDGLVNPVNNGTNAATINMTTNQTFDLTVEQSDSSTGNAISAYIVTLEAIN